MRKREKRKARERACNTFEAISQEWFEQRKGGWSPNHAARVLASLEKEVFPKLGHRPVAEIEAMELLEVLREIERRDALEIVSRVLRRCSTVFRYAVQTGRCKHNVAADLQGALKTPERKHYSSLSISDLPEFLKKLADYDGHLQTRLGLRLLLLTATRTVELRAARWEEFDFDNALWGIPADKLLIAKPNRTPGNSFPASLAPDFKGCLKRVTRENIS